MATQTNKISVIGVPLDHGAGRRGVGMGPAALRIAGLHAAIQRLGHEVCDLGDLEIPAPEAQPSSEIKAKFLNLITKTCWQIEESVRGVLEAGGFPLVLGGDHSIAIGSVSGVANHLRNVRGPTAKLGVIWFDAHGDINTPETSPSGNIHGMPVSCLLGNGPEALSSIGYEGCKLVPDMFCQIGLRSIDETEKQLLRNSGIHCYTTSDIERRGMCAIMEEAIAHCADADMLHVSFDIDSVDPRIAPGTGTPKLGGLTFREAHLAMEMLADTGQVTSAEMVEVNPTLDDGNKTAELAVGLLATMFGQRIL